MKSLTILSIITLLSLNLNAQTILSADGPGNTYELIENVLAPGYNPLETPDCSHPDFGRHIDEVWDSTLNEYVFRFFIHVVPDDDRCINQDRQRNEIKTYNESPDSLKGFESDTVVYQWKFKLDSLFQPSTSFTHIHQLKAVGGSESSMPVITLTPRKATPERLELKYAESTSQETLKTADLSLFKGNWVSVLEKVRYGEEGSYEITINRIADGQELFHFKNSNIRMWRTGANFIRPKWGIYRSLNHPEHLRDEQVLFNKFVINKVSSLSVGEHNVKPGNLFYPNPAKDVIYFHLSNNDYRFSKLMDCKGKVILQNKDYSIPQLNISGLPKGMFFLEFVREGDYYYQKLIKL